MGGSAARTPGYGWFNHPAWAGQLPESLGDGRTPAAHRRFTCRNFRKSGSLNFSNFGLNLMLANPLVNQLSST
ncbi:hypothetical protein B296_00001236 [Ensete ventricosum]|uniref:Uncharacterized protein n=1 Tax=Ensete ventricosum TaxID=4639 RepID=A0A427ABU9_ENSVE|nr:hypothetical protein B296_00001236 [Ensete ventricosum]